MKKIIMISLLLSLSGCQLVSPIFVDYNGVRMDVAKWINSQTLLSMQQKRSLVQLSKAQQQLHNYSAKDDSARFSIAKQNQIALHCAHLYVSDKKIAQLQQQIFGDEKALILERYHQLAPAFKLDEKSIQCE
ncbi:hypothetical protein AZH43_04160 [Acinetobacter pragensis]|uniref:Lipoprotein n=1 Tax=Acinetobacter pragensis TaxID=1806892 RepID=A0A151XY33_9GAMM|nr:hypothetical protein AZH43_04160 [Acinetobacter pragensis]